MAANYLIYGANGYTGALIARMAAARGDRPILAGRRAEAVAPLAAELGLEHRHFDLHDPAALDAGLLGMGAVIHCAGPFAHTARAMVDACLRTRAHYLDITGEVSVFESLAARSGEARQAGVVLLPGAGFDVVPSDCLAAHLKRRLPSATHLSLGIQALASLSRGTAITMAENAHRGGLVRRAGVLVPVPAAWKTRVIDFGLGNTRAVTIPWGDVSTAFHSTGIPNIEVYVAAPWPMRMGLRLTRVAAPLLRAPSVQRFLRRRIAAGPSGPSDEQRARGQSFLWGEVIDERGARAVSRLKTPEGYTLTALTALEAVKRILGRQAAAGFQTPSLAFGPDFILDIAGTTRTDQPAP